MLFDNIYDCIYEAVGKSGNDLEHLDVPFRIALGHYACYASAYKYIRGFNYSDVTYKIYLFAENIEGKAFNLCSKNETKKILRCLQKTVPFTYKFSKGKYTMGEYNHTETDFNILTIHLIGTYTQHVWVTSMLRCFYEWPYNVAAKEACALQSEIKEFDGLDLSKQNWINLYLTVAAKLGSSACHGVVSLSAKNPKPRTYHEWKQKLASPANKASGVFNILQKDGIPYKASNRLVMYITNQETYDEGPRSRASKYVSAYKDKLSWKK